MAKILVVEDDELFLKTLTLQLAKAGHDVDDALNGEYGKNKLIKNNYDLVISDIRMPLLDGIGLLAWSREVGKDVPFMIMTGFAAILETISAYDLGAEEFIAKPFKIAELLNLINKILFKKSITENNEPFLHEGTNQFCRLYIDDFPENNELSFDLFVKLGDSKFVRVAKKGEFVLKDKLQQYREKGVGCFYINHFGLNSLVNFNSETFEKESERSDKVDFVNLAESQINTKLKIGFLDNELFADAKAFVLSALSVLIGQDEIFEQLELLNAHSSQLLTRSLLTAILSYMLAKKRGFESLGLHFKLTTASLLLDIGKTELNIKILEKEPEKLLEDEKIVYCSHVELSKGIVKKFKAIGPDVIKIIYEHHENLIGSGYPLGTKLNDHHALSKIIQLTSFFSEKLLSSELVKLPLIDFFSEINQAHKGCFDDKLYSALEEIFILPKIK